MKSVFGIALILIGIFLGLYVGIWWGFIGGIVQIVEAIRAEQLVAMDVACGVARIIFANLFGWLSAAVFVFPGAVLLKDE